MISTAVEIEFLDHKHADEMQALASHKEVAETTSLPHPYPADGAFEFINATLDKRQREEEFVFAVINSEAVFVGTCALLKCDFEKRRAILGYWIGKPYWGKGYATAAAGKAISFAFDVLKLDVLVTSCIQNNSASIRVLEKLGFKTTGESELALPKWPVPKKMIDFQLNKEEYKIQETF